MKKTLVIVLLFLIPAMSAVLAADVPPQNSGRALQEFADMLAQSDQTAQQPEKNSEIVVNSNQPETTAQGGSEVFVGSIIWEGADGIDARMLNLIAADYIGKRNKIADLKLMTQIIDEYLRGQGLLLAQVSLPQQKLNKDGALKVALYPGRYGKIVLKNSSALGEGVILARIGKGITSGGLIYKQELDRTVLRINDLAGAAARMSVDATKTKGVSDLLIAIADDGTPAISGNVFFNNYGNVTTGQYQGMLNVAWNNPAKYGDSLGVALMGGINNSWQNGIDSGAVNYYIPDGWLGGNLNFSVSQVDYSLLGTIFSALEAKGSATSGAVTYNWPIERGRISNLNLDFGVSYKYLKDNMASNLNSDNLRSTVEGMIGLDGSFYDAELGGGYNLYGINFNIGNFGSSNGCSTWWQNKYQEAGMTGVYTYGTANFQSYRYLADRLQFFVSGNGQLAGKNLNSADKITLGGPYAVRAYAPGEASGDQGILGTAELRYSVNYPWERQLGVMTPYLFVDGGYVQYNQNPLPNSGANTTALGDLGCGISLTQGGNYGGKIDYAWIMPGSPASSDGSTSRLWFRLYKLF
ncbi:MAG: ShlB/FhaC/HecB family hemolysin secretion/activation protein [Negativicutes bacterium]